MRLGSWNQLLKIPNYLKICLTRYPRAQSASLYPELPQGLLKVNSCSSTGFSLHRGSGKCPCCCLWQYAWQEPVCSWQYLDLPVAQTCFKDSLPAGKESACNEGDQGSICGLGRPSGEGNGNPLQYSCLENPMDREAWWATVHEAAKSRMHAWLKCVIYLILFKIVKPKRSGVPRMAV